MHKMSVYNLDRMFDEGEWKELIDLDMDADPKPGKGLTRRQWLNVADICLGKAQRIETGIYGGDGFEDEEDREESMRWGLQLREIASKILNEFKPGDMKF